MLSEDPNRNAYRAEHDLASTDELSETLAVALEAAADREDRPLSASVFDVVDPDALDALFAPTAEAPRHHGELVFAVDGFEVTIRADGAIVIRPPGG